jgi:hypothetical protein
MGILVGGIVVDGGVLVVGCGLVPQEGVNNVKSRNDPISNIFPFIDHLILSSPHQSRKSM